MRDVAATFEEVRNDDRIFVVLAKPQRQRLESLQELEGVERRNRRANVAQQLDARAQRIGDRSERLRRLGPDRAVVGFIRLREQGEALGVLLPREIAAIDDQAADRCAVSADVFRRGIDDDRRAVLERPRDQRSGRVVGDQRNAERPADVGDLADRKDVELRVGEDLGVISARLRVGRAAERLGIARIDEAGLDAELLQRLREQRPRAAVEIGRRDDVVAGLGEVQHRIGGGRLPRGDRESRSAAFERRDAGLERVPGWVLDAGIDVAELFKREEPRGVPGVLELVGGRLVDRHRDCAADRVGAIGAAVQRQSLRSQFVFRHGCLPGICGCGWVQ